MPLYDNDGSSNREIQYIFDHNNSVNTQIGSIYDNNGSSNTLIYSSELTVYPGYPWDIRGNDTDETSVNPPNITVRETQGNGGSSAVYTYVNVSGYQYLYMDYSVYYVSNYGQGLVGYGNFDSFTTDAWPSVTGIGWSNSITASHTDPNGNQWGSGSMNKRFTLSIPVGSLSSSICVGIACTSRSSIQATTNLVLNRCWLA